MSGLPRFAAGSVAADCASHLPLGTQPPVVRFTPHGVLAMGEKEQDNVDDDRSNSAGPVAARRIRVSHCWRANSHPACDRADSRGRSLRDWPKGRLSWASAGVA